MTIPTETKERNDATDMMTKCSTCSGTTTPMRKHKDAPLLACNKCFGEWLHNDPSCREWQMDDWEVSPTKPEPDATVERVRFCEVIRHINGVKDKRTGYYTVFGDAECEVDYSGEYVKASDYAALQSQFTEFLTRAGAEIRDGELVFNAAGYGAFTKRKGTLMAKQILAEHGELIDIAHHFRHCRDCGEGSSCFEGDGYFERLQAISSLNGNSKTEKQS